MTGRAVSAAIHSRLRDALAQGEPRTYAQLAEHAGCTVRSVRNYLSRSKEIFGFAVEQTRAAGSHSVLVRAAGVPAQVRASPEISSSLVAGLRDRLFHTESATRTPDDRPTCLTVCFRGIPSYSALHEKLLTCWLQACCQVPRSAVRLRVSGRDAAPELMLWPLGAVLHNIEGLLLVGLPLEADALDAVRVINLDSVSTDSDAIEWVDRKQTGEPAVDLSAVDLAELIDLPFSACPVGQDSRVAVNVHVRFEAAIANRMRTRVWHRAQTAVLRTDGSLDVKFGPVDLDVAASWVSSFGDAARVVGDKKLRKAVKKRSFCP
jgi:hypothetical protein